MRSLIVGTFVGVAIALAGFAPSCRAEQNSSADTPNASSALALNSCIALSIDANDSRLLAKWFYLIVSGQPDVASMVNVDPKVRDRIQRDVAQVFERVLHKDCSPQLVAASNESGEEVVGEAFGVLVDIGGELFADNRSIESGLEATMKRIDFEKIGLLMADAEAP